MLSKIPVWVFFVFAALVFAGYRQTRTRQVPPAMVVGLALAMFGLSLYGVIAAFGAKAAPLCAWALGIATSVTLGRNLFGPRGLVLVSSSRVEVPGSGLPLTLMMSLFGAKFALGFATALGAPIVADPWFAAAASGAFGLLSGAFTARALVVRRFVRDAGAARPDAAQSGVMPSARAGQALTTLGLEGTAWRRRTSRLFGGGRRALGYTAQLSRGVEQPGSSLGS